MNVRSDCRICHSRNLSLILKLAPTPIGDQFLLVPREQPLHPIDLYQCHDCGLAQLLYEITPDDIYEAVQRFRDALSAVDRLENPEAERRAET